MKTLTLTTLLLASLLACSVDNNDDQDLFDRNGDGKGDVSIEVGDNYLIEHIDRNFDGMPDESHRYDNDNTILKSNIDDDFNGYFETRVFYKYEVASLSAVDSNQDSVFDLFFLYEFGSVRESAKYIQEKRESSATIEVVKYFLGYPVEKRVVSSELTPVEFQKHFLISPVEMKSEFNTKWKSGF